MPRVPKGTVSTALLRGVLEKDVHLGIARWVFGEGQWRSLEPDALRKVVRACAPAGLASPHEVNRRRTLYALGRIADDEAVQLLTSVLRGQIPLRELEHDVFYAVGFSVVKPCDADVPQSASDSAYAALLLARLGVADVRQDIERLVKDAVLDDVFVYCAALRLLAESDKP